MNITTKKYIFLDKASTTITCNLFFKQIKIYKTKIIGNPSSIHFLGQQSRSMIEQSRREIMNLLKMETTSLIFTSSASESNNLIINNFNYDYYVSINIIHASIFNLLITKKNKII